MVTAHHTLGSYLFTLYGVKHFGTVWRVKMFNFVWICPHAIYMNCRPISICQRFLICDKNVSCATQNWPLFLELRAHCFTCNLERRGVMGDKEGRGSQTSRGALYSRGSWCWRLGHLDRHTHRHTDPNTHSSLSAVVAVFSPRLENKQRSMREKKTERGKQRARKQRAKRGKQANRGWF